MITGAARRKLLKQIQAEYDNFDYKPWAMPILKVGGFFLRTFKTMVTFEEKPPSEPKLSDSAKSPKSPKSCAKERFTARASTMPVKNNLYVRFIVFSFC